MFTQLADQPGPGGAAFYAIYVVRSDGTGARRLTERCLDCANDPSWSPDGSKIAYTEPDGIHVMKADGSGGQRLCAFVCGSAPAWSPDGTEIASGLTNGVGIVPAGGGRVRRLGTNHLRPESIDWSPDGSRLAIGETGNRVYLIGRNGRGLRLIARDATSPRWSRDGTKLLFAKGDGSVIYLKTLGSAPRVIRRLPKGQAFYLSWSSDGARIAYSGWNNLHVLDLTTGIDRRIDVPRICRWPRLFCADVDWQPR